MSENFKDSSSLPKIRRPKCTIFYQQKLPSWRPDFTAASTTIPTLVIVGSVFVCIGLILRRTSNGVGEFSVDYTHENCRPSNAILRMKYATCADYVQKNNGYSCHCNVEFDLQEPLRGQTFMYYGLSNYYQNHRLYVRSRDNQQLAGRKMTYDQLSDDCHPYIGDEARQLVYAPCGLIANSMFNDTVTLSYYFDGGSRWNRYISVPLLDTGIAWDTDKKVRFRNPPGGFSDTIPPPYWQHPVTSLRGQSTSNTSFGYENEDLIVWMRVAAFPTFRKLYRRVDHRPSATSGGHKVFENGLPVGNYSLSIVYAYPVAEFSGRKSIILSTTSWLGGRNPFLGYAYVGTGAMFILFGLVHGIIRVQFAHRSVNDN